MNNSLSLEQKKENLRQKFMTGVYSWMVLALTISGACAWFTANSDTMLRLIFGNKFTFFGLIIAEFALVLWLSSQIRTMKVTTAIIAFVAYSVLNGVTLSVVFIAYTGASIARIFLITALMFGGMSLYGMTTKSDLRSAGRYLMMAVIGLVIASVVNIFLKSSMLDWIVSIVTVGVFTGLTAYDTQKLLAVAEHADESEAYQKIAIIGALELYLDFINILLALLRLFGKKND